MSGLRRRVGWYLDQTYGAGVVTVPPTSTFNRLVHAVGEGRVAGQRPGAADAGVQAGARTCRLLWCGPGSW